MTEHEILLRAYKFTNMMCNKEVEANEIYNEQCGCDCTLSKVLIERYANEANELYKRLIQIDKEEQQ